MRQAKSLARRFAGCATPSMLCWEFDHGDGHRSFTPFLRRLKHGTPNILRLLKKHSILADVIFGRATRRRTIP